MVTLNEAREFERLGVPSFAEHAQTRRFSWHHLPVPDLNTPGPVFAAAWADTGPAIAAALDRGDRIAVHCAAGLGRTGTFVAKLLVDRGMTADAAIALVRAQRPGTIETEAQATFVRQSPRLL